MARRAVTVVRVTRAAGGALQRARRCVPRSLLRIASPHALWLGLLLTIVGACGHAGADDAAARPSAPEVTASPGIAMAPAGTRQAGTTQPGSATAIDVDREQGATDVRSSVGFRSRQRLNEHYAKHGAEFGSVSRDEYLRQAQSLRDAAVGGAILDAQRPDGTLSRFDRSSGAFVAFDADGTIRTFFRPNDGEAYFRRQARRRPTP